VHTMDVPPRPSSYGSHCSPSLGFECSRSFSGGASHYSRSARSRNRAGPRSKTHSIRVVPAGLPAHRVLPIARTEER
jgi:hypothetical protein